MEKNITVLVINIYMAGQDEMVRFPSRNQGVLNSSFIMTIEKTITIEDMKKPETQTFSEKASQQNKPKADINSLPTHTQEYPDSQYMANSNDLFWGN